MISEAAYAPDIPLGECWSTNERRILEAFVTDPDGYVSVIRNLPPEVAGALISRASRSTKPLLRVLLDDCILPILSEQQGKMHEAATGILRSPLVLNRLLVEWGRKFYSKWYGDFGDDSIGQVTGVYLAYPMISQVAIKHIEDQRIGVEPIEKSTRYVDYGKKVNERYLYYIPSPDLPDITNHASYCAVTDLLFVTYSHLVMKFRSWLSASRFASASAIEKKAFDTLRGLLPMATMSQMAMRANAQSLEFLLNRSFSHECGEIRYFARETYDQLIAEIPSLMGRVTGADAERYREYLTRSQEAARTFAQDLAIAGAATPESESVKLVDYDGNGEAKVIAGLLYEQTQCSWSSALSTAIRMIENGSAAPFLDTVFDARSDRWMKVPRALENASVRFDICMNIGSWRDLHRHRMLTQQRQPFTANLGYDVPEELREAGLEGEYCRAMDSAGELYRRLSRLGQHVAQYCVPLGYKMRFQQHQNLREAFWEIELRTGSQGHPDYRRIEQKKFELLCGAYPLLARYMKADTGSYYFARR